MSEFVKSILRAISSSMQIPTIIILIILILVTIVMLGAIIAEVFTERRRLTDSIPSLVDDMQKKSIPQLKTVIEESGILRRQKEAALELLNRSDYPANTREALARQLIADEESHYNSLTKVTDIIARIAPMFGLMGTLIPLGPGLMALAQGDTKTLSDSLLIAFDTTVAGLISAAVCYVISGIRRNWYEGYMVGLETIMETILEEQSRTDLPAEPKAPESEAAEETVQAESSYKPPQKETEELPIPELVLAPQVEVIPAPITELEPEVIPAPVLEPIPAPQPEVISKPNNEPPKAEANTEEEIKEVSDADLASILDSIIKNSEVDK